jgi:hypothetical protein
MHHFNLFELYMNTLIYNFLIGLFIIIMLSCAFSKNNLHDVNESFVPTIVKETYRPIQRNIRRRVEGFYDKSSTNISNLFRKFGII